MKKILLIILCLITLVGCKNKTTEVIEEPKEEIKNDIKIWSVEPTLEFDDIYVDFSFTERSLNADSWYFDETYYFAENDNVYEGYDKGGCCFSLNGGIGFIDSNGEIKGDSIIYSYTKTNDGIVCYTNSTPFKAYKLNSDYTYTEIIQEFPLSNFSSTMENYAINSLNKNGSLKNYFSGKTINNIYQYAIERGVSNGESIVVISSIVTNDDLNEENGYLYGFVLVNDKEQKALNIELKNKNLINYSNGILLIEDLKDIILPLDNTETCHYVANDKEIYANDLSYAANNMFYANNVSYYKTNGDLVATGFSDGTGFYEGLAAVCKNGKWGYIDTNGNVVVDFIFDKTTPLADGKAWVMYKGKVGKLNIKDMIDNGIEFSNENLSQ